MVEFVPGTQEDMVFTPHIRGFAGLPWEGAVGGAEWEEEAQKERRVNSEAWQAGS